MTDFKYNFEMTTQSQSQSSILKSLPPADSVTKIPKSNDDVSKNQSSKIHTSSEDDLDYFVAFTRRYGKTYSPYGNIGPVVKKFGKTYSSHGNIKNANVDSKPSTESKPKKHGKPVSVKNASVSKKLNIKDSSTLEHHLKGKDVRDLSAQNERLPFPETLSQVNKKKKVPLKYSPQSGSEKHVISQSKSLSEESANLTINLKSHSSEENDFYYSKKAIITDSAKSKGHFKKSNDLVTEKIKVSDDKSKRVIFLKKSFLGKPVMTFHLLPSSNTSTISPVRHTSGNEGSNSTGDKTLLKYQQVLADKNSVSDSETLVDQIAPGSFGIVNKSHSSHIKNIFPVSASRKDKNSTPAKLSADSAKKTFVCRHKKNLTLESTATSIKTQPLSESSFVDISGAETDKNGMSASEAKEFKQFDPRSQMNTYVRSKNLDSTSILPVSVNSEALQVDIVSRSNADALKSPQNVLIVPKSTKDIPNKKTKGKPLPAEEISIADISVNKMKSLKPKKKLKRLKETSKVSSSDSKSNKLPKKLSKSKKKILKVQSDCCFFVSENSTISGISNDLKLTSKVDNSEKFNPSSQLLTEKMIDGALEEDMKKTKLKPVPTELALVSVDCPSSLINADKTGKKFVKKKKRMLSNKEKLLKKMKLLKSEKLKIMSPKKKVKLSNLFLNDAGKVCEKTIKSQFLPTLEKFEPVLKEHHLRVEGSTDDMPVLEDATKATPLQGQGQRKMSGLQKRASNSMYISKSTNTELFVSGKEKKIKSKRLSPEMKAGKTSLLTKGKTRNSKSSKMSTGKIAKMPKLSKVSKVSEKVKTSKSSSDAKTRKRKLSELSVDSQKNKVSTDVKKKPFKSSKPRISTEKSKLSESYNEMSDLSELSFVTGASICKSANFSPDKLEMSKLSKLSPVKSMEESQQSECPALFRALELMKKLVDTTDSDIPEVKASVAKSEISDSPELEKLETKTNLASSAMPISSVTESMTGSSLVDVPSNTKEVKFSQSSQQINIPKPSLHSACISSAKLWGTPDSAIKTSVCEHKTNLASSSTPIPIKAKPPSESSFVDTLSSQTDKSKMSSQQINIQKPSLHSACISSAKLSVTPDSAVKTSVCDHKKNYASSSTSIPIKAEPLSESSFVDTLSSQTDKRKMSSQQINIQKSFSLADVSSATISVTSKSIVKKSDCHHKKNLASSSTPIPSITEQILESSLADTQSNKIDRNTLSSPKINIQKPLSQVSVSDTTISVTSKSIVKNSDCKHNKNLALASTPISSKTKQILESSLSDTQSNNADRNTLSSPQNDIQKPLSQVSISCTTTSTTENSVFDNFVKPGLLVSGSSKKLNEPSKLLSPATTQSIPTSLPNFQSKTLSKTSDKDSLNRSNVLLPPTNVPKPSLSSVCTSVTPIPAVTCSDCQHEIKIVSSYSISTYSYDTINSICKTSSSNKIHPVKTDNLVSGTSKKSEDSVKLLVPATIQSTSISLPNFQSQTFLNNTGKSPLIQPNVLVPQINIGKASSSPVCTSATLSVNPNSAVNKFVCRHKKNLALSSTPIPIKAKPPSESSFVDTPSSQTDKSKMSSQQINIQKPSLPSACISSAKLSVTPDSAVKTSVCDHKKNLASSSTSIPIKTEPLSESSFVDTLSSQTDKSKMSSQQINIQKPSLPSACISSAKLSVTPDSAVKTSVCDHKKNLASSSTSIPIKAEPLSESSFVDTLSSQTDKSKMSSQQINIQKPSLPSACISSAKLSVTPDYAVKTSVCDHKKNLASSSTSIPIKAEPLSESSFVDTLSSQTDKSKMSSQQINIQKPSLPSACISSAKLSVTPDSAAKTSVCDHEKNLASSSTSISIKAEPLSESSFVDTLSSQTDKSKMSSQQINIQKPSLPSACIYSAKLSVTPDSAVKTFVSKHKKNLASSSAVIPQINIGKASSSPVCTSAALSVNPNSAVSKFVCRHKKNLALSSTPIPIKAKPPSESSFVDTPSSQTDKSKMSSQQINIQKPSLPSACISSAKLSVTPDSAVKTSVCDHKKNLASSSTSIPIKAEPLSESSFVDTLSSQTDKSKMSSQQINIQKSFSLADVSSATISVTSKSIVKKSDCHHKKNLASSLTPIPSITKRILESSLADTQSNKIDRNTLSSPKINIQKPLSQVSVSDTTTSVTAKSGFDYLVKPDMLASKPKKLNEHTKLWLPVSTQSIPTSSSNLNNSGKTLQPVVDQAIPLSAAKTNGDPLGSTNAINANSVCLQGLENATVSTNNVGMELTSPSSHDIKMSNRVSIVPCLAKPVTKVTLLPKRENIVKHEMATCDVLPRTHSVEGMKLCSKSSVKKQESTVMPSTDNVPPKSTSPANCTSSLGPTPLMGLQTNDSATPSKPPSVSVSAVAMPSSAKMSDTSSSRHLSPPEPKLKSNQRRLWKKPFKMNKNKLAYLAYKKHLSCGRQKMSTSVHMLCSDCNYPFTHRHKLGIHLKLRKDLHKTCFVHRWMHKGKFLQHKGAAKKRNNQSANKVTSIDNDNIKDPNSTTVPKSSEDNKKFVKLTDCKSTNLLRINSKKLTPEKAHCSKKVRKSLKAKQNVSHGFKDFQALDSSESLQGNSDNSSKPNFVKTQPATEIISGRQELGISNLSPPMLSPQNASPTSATYGDESLGSPLQIEDPPFLSKVQYPNENLKIFSSGFLKLQADRIINKLIKEDQADSVPSSCPEISTAASTVDSADVQKEKDILVEDVKKSENLEKNDDLSSETFHQQERIIFLSNNDDPNFSGNSKSMPRVGSPRTIVQCSMKDESDDTNLSKESSRNPSETLSTKDSKATCREVLLEDTTTKEIAKTSAREKNSGTSKSPNSLESLPQLPNIATDEQCSDSNKDLAIKSNLVSEKPKPDSELYLKPVRCVPKRNYKKPQKYFCVDFDTSGWTGGKTSNLSPVVTSTNTSSLTNTSPAKSRAVTCEPSKDISNRTKENFNEKNKTNCTNNKINNNNNINTITTNKCNRNAKDNNDKVNTTTTTTIKNKSNDIDNKNHSNANNNNELEESEKNVQRSRSQYNSKNKKIMEETTVEARNWNKELQKKKLLRLRFKDFIPRLYDNSKLAKKVADEEQTDSPQTSVENSSEPHESVTRMTTSSPHAQKPLLSAIKSEWDVIPMPTKTWREELVDNLINYNSANSDGIEKVSGNSCQIKSEECNVRTEPIQLSKLLGNPQTVVSSPAVITTTTTTTAAYPALRFPLIAPNTVRRIATFLPVTNMDATNNMAVPLTIFGNTMPVFTNLGNNQVFLGNLPAPLPMPIVQDQKQEFPQILTTLPEPKTANEETTNFCPELKIKKEVVTNDDEYGGRQSDNAFGLRITGVAGNVTTHNTIPPLPDAIYSNAGSVDGHNADQRPKKQVLIRRRSLQCTLLQTVDSFGVSEFLFECCGSSFSTSLELASHIDLCHS